MLNIVSVNMPKIKPETKVLIIKKLKSKSHAEVADIFNVTKWQVERIHKHYQETADVHDRPMSGRPQKTTAQDDRLLVRHTAPGGVDASDACFVKNCMPDSCSQWSPRPYCCPETSAKPETAKKLCCGTQPDGRLEEAWGTKPNNLEELWDACKVAFHAIPDDFINKLYDSLSNQMANFLQAKDTSKKKIS